MENTEKWLCPQVKLDEDDLTFFIDNYKAACAIYAANLRLTMRDGWKVSMHLKNFDFPVIESLL